MVKYKQVFWGQIDFIIQKKEKNIFVHFLYKGRGGGTGGGPQNLFKENTDLWTHAHKNFFNFFFNFI